MATIPEIRIYSHNMDKFFPTTPVDGEEKLFKSVITIPENDTDEDIQYVFEAYMDDDATGLFVHVLVLGDEAGHTPERNITIVINLDYRISKPMGEDMIMDILTDVKSRL